MNIARLHRNERETKREKRVRGSLIREVKNAHGKIKYKLYKGSGDGYVSYKGISIKIEKVKECSR